MMGGESAGDCRVRRYRTAKKPATISAMITSSKPSTVIPRLLP
jgi:hypothetical protein